MKAKPDPNARVIQFQVLSSSEELLILFDDGSLWHKRYSTWSPVWTPQE